VNVTSVRKKFTTDHKCAMKGVFLMELNEGDDATALAEDLGISLHALTGISGANTMQLMVTIAYFHTRCRGSSPGTRHHVTTWLVREGDQ
jgi:hypothetical protein